MEQGIQEGLVNIQIDKLPYLTLEGTADPKQFVISVNDDFLPILLQVSTLQDLKLQSGTSKILAGIGNIFGTTKRNIFIEGSID